MSYTICLSPEPQWAWVFLFNNINTSYHRALVIIVILLLLSFSPCGPRLFVCLGGGLGSAPLLNPPRAYPSIDRLKWGPRGPALRASGVSAGSSTCMWGPGVHCLHSPSFGEPTGLRERSNDLCPTLRATHGQSHANHLLHRHQQLTRLRIIAGARPLLPISFPPESLP